MDEKESVRKLLEMVSELDVMYADIKHKFNTILPVNIVNVLYDKFHGTELGDAIKPLKDADTLLSEVTPLMILYLQGAIDEVELVKRFNRHSQKALNGVTIEEYVNLARVYMNAYSSPVNSLDDIIEVLKAKFMHPEIITC